MLVIAHRGANREALENSFKAFDLAVEVGAARIEFDVHRTTDGHFVVMHDDDLMRTASHPGCVAKLTRAELAEIPLIDGQKIPFLDQVIERYAAQIELNIEVKGSTLADGEALAAMLESTQFADRLIISSFHLAPLQYLSEAAPHLQLACLWGDVLEWPHFSHFAPPVFMQGCNARIFHPWTGFLDRSVMEQARARGWHVYAYASMRGEDEDREGLWTFLQTLGVDGLCTNYPRELMQWLNEVDEDGKRVVKSAGRH